MITSFSNPRIRAMRRLIVSSKARDEEKRFVVEGIRSVEEARERWEYLVYTEEVEKDPPGRRLIELAKASQRPCLLASDKIVEKISGTESPPGILAVVAKVDYRLTDAFKDSLVIGCVEIQDPGNLGTIIRTADAAGAGGVVVTRDSADLYNPKTVRATMGSLFHLPVVVEQNLSDITVEAKKGGYQIMATGVHASREYFKIDFRKRWLILIGNEARGLPKEALDAADERVKIPIFGRAESLNAAAAAAVLLFEGVRQRHYEKNVA